MNGRAFAVLAGFLVSAAAVYGVTLEFRLDPAGPAVGLIPLKGEFYVALKGAKGVGDPRLFIWNLQKNRSTAVLSLSREQGELIWGPIQLRRACDPICEGMAAVISADVGDILVAAVNLAGDLAQAPKSPGEMPPGPSVTALVVTPESVSHAVELFDSAGNETEELCCGTYTVRLEAPDLDISCEPEEVPLRVISGERSVDVPLLETGGATGIFTAVVQVECRLTACSLLLSSAEPKLSLGAKVGFIAGNSQLTATVAGLPFEIAVVTPGNESVSNPHVDVGQVFTLQILGVKEYDEVRFCVDGIDVGSDRHMTFDEPGAHTIRAFVRQGCRWGVQELVVTALPRTEIKPLGFDPENVAATRTLQFKLLHAGDDPSPVVYVGKIGEGCPKAILAQKVNDGYTFSVTPAEFGADSGDALWIYYEDPNFPADSTYVIVYLQ